MTAIETCEWARIGAAATGSRAAAPAAAMFAPDPRWMDTPRGTAEARGLDVVERKARRRSEPAVDEPAIGGSGASWWISVPFAALFILGSLTLR